MATKDGIASEVTPLFLTTGEYGAVLPPQSRRPRMLWMNATDIDTSSQVNELLRLLGIEIDES